MCSGRHLFFVVSTRWILTAADESSSTSVRNERMIDILCAGSQDFVL